MTRSDELFCL